MPKQGEKKAKSNRKTPAVRDVTINLHKRLHGQTFKTRAPRAIREIRKFAQSTMGTKDVRVTVALNQFLWSRGVKSVPNRVRVRLQRQRADGEAEGLYTLVDVVHVQSFKGLTTKTVDAE
jgi:large subunit ribosomal protein L31e